MSEESRKYTAFVTDRGLYEFIRMPFGLSNCPATFHKLMSKLLGHRHDCIYFFDDVVLFHNNIIDHVKALDEIFNIFYEHGLTIRPSKTDIAFATVQFLGFIVGQGKLLPNNDNIKKILNIKKPTTKKHVRAIIGLVNFYSKFIPHIATLLAPLSDLIVKGKSAHIRWTEDCQKSIKIIQEIINDKATLILPNPNDTFYVQTDASDTGIGGVLLQKRDGILRPCLFVARKLLARERKYATIEKEGLAIVWTVAKLSRYLIGTNFVIFTDHKALQFMGSARSKNSRILRWSLSMEQFQYTIKHIPGSLNILADYISRYI